MPATSWKIEFALTALLAGCGAALSGQPLTPVKPAEDSTIARARQVANDFAKALPNFVCQEVMSRFQSDTPHTVWQPLDVVAAELVYENGKEDYRNVKINGKPANKRMEQLFGSWSTGEFGSLMVQLFSPVTAAGFHFRNDTSIAGKRVRTYGFDVSREHSQWLVEVAGQSTLPAYGGSVSIEAETARVLRIEMKAYDLPERFPASRVESMTDYEYVPIGGERYLLPSHCETWTCDRGSTLCARNVIYFVDCHKYSSDSTIRFGKDKL